MSVEEVSLDFLGGDLIQYFGLDPIDPRYSYILICDHWEIVMKFKGSDHLYSIMKYYFSSHHPSQERYNRQTCEFHKCVWLSTEFLLYVSCYSW